MSPIDRRGFLLGAAALLAAQAARAQKMPRIGVLWHAGSAEEERVPLAAFREGLKRVGYEEGRNILVEHRYPNEEPAKFQRFAEELVAMNVDVLVAVTRPAAIAAQRATRSIPIVFVVVPDPLGSRLVAALARPGANVTGLSTMAVELTGKRLEFLKEAMPALSKVALLVNAGDPEGAQRYVDVSSADASRLGLTVQPVEVRAAGDFPSAFARISREQQAVASSQDGLFYVEMRRMAALALEHKLPLIGFAREMAAVGNLMSYGPSSPAIFRRTGVFIDRILKGGRPADLPVEQPAAFELHINASTAKAIGLRLSPALLSRADSVIGL
jgi:putative tryptophan/tyrosine transport system substrate-binding protein